MYCVHHTYVYVVFNLLANFLKLVVGLSIIPKIILSFILHYCNLKRSFIMIFIHAFIFFFQNFYSFYGY